MQGLHLYEYAVIRIVPRVEREEFVNAGVVILCKQENFLQCKIHLDERKLRVMDADADLALICAYLESFRQICNSELNGSPIALQDTASRFRWLTAVRSSVIQTSRPHSGFSVDLAETVNELFAKYVG